MKVKNSININMIQTTKQIMNQNLSASTREEIKEAIIEKVSRETAVNFCEEDRVKVCKY